MSNNENVNENVENSSVKGGVSVQTEHIFPIIKKWLYSEKEIFLREIVSNASDAVTKLKRLISLGEVHDIDDDFKINVKIDKDAGTLTVSDNGIGMTQEEVQKYICQIALSGALDFIAKYENTEDGAPGIIGHFGLGFYSCFMVSDTVDVVTRSFTGAPAVKWICSEAGEYEILPCDRDERGTDIIMHITDEEKEYLEEGKIREILEKYCSFMPVPIYLEVVPNAEETKKKENDEKEHDHGHEHDHDDECDCDECSEKDTEKPINDVCPLWQKLPSECTDDEYKAFYTKLFHDFREPLFHIHINADYPLNFKGILYFPRLNHEFDSLEGQVKLYYNQVFVADNIKELIPEYMLMLKGVLDCPELPLNVSRSYLQNNAYVTKVSSHIVKKVCDKLNSMFNTDRENYEKLWPDIKLFAEYASLRDRKFYDRVKDSLLLPITDGSYSTLNEYLDSAKDKHENVIYYASDKVTQAQYISMFNAQDIKVVLFDKIVETQFMSMLEQEKNVKFVRIDAELADALKGEGEKYENEKLSDLFREVSGQEKLNVKFENLCDERIPAILNISEQSRRMEDMMKMYRMAGEDAASFSMPLDTTLILNGNSSLVRKLGDITDDDSAKKIAKQIYTLALLAQRQLSATELQNFLHDSFDILEKGM